MVEHSAPRCRTEEKENEIHSEIQMLNSTQDCWMGWGRMIIIGNVEVVRQIKKENEKAWA